MKLTLLSTGLFLSLSASLVEASSSSTYRGELNLNYHSNEQYADAAQIDFKWYFQPVTNSFQKMFKKTISHPFAESAFLEKSSSLSFSYNVQQFDSLEELNPITTDIDFSELDITTITEFDISRTRAKVEYFIPKSIFYVGIQYDHTNLQLSDESEDDIKTNQWLLAAGIMIADNFLISSNYKQDEDYKPNVDAKYVSELGGGTAVNFTANYTRLDTDKYPVTTAVESDSKKDKEKNFISVSADYYFDRTFSLGTGILYIDETGYEFRAQKFFSDAISAKLMYRTFEENNTYAIGLTARL